MSNPASAFGTIIQIGDILVSEDVVMEWFSCNYDECKGICCIEGDAGAPIDESELPRIEREYPRYCGGMRECGREAIDANGFFEVDRDGDIVTTLVPGSGVCAYANFLDNGGCICAMQACGCTKPISCSLYPIRVTKLTGGGKALNVHHWDICKGAFIKGEKEGTRVYQFLKEPLIQAFGEDFWDALDAAAKHLIEVSAQ